MPPTCAMTPPPEAVGVLGIGAFGAMLADALAPHLGAGGLMLSTRGVQSAAAAARHGLQRLDNQDLVDRCRLVFLCVRAEHAVAAVQALRWRAGQFVVSTCASLPRGALTRDCLPAGVVRALPVPPASGLAGHSLLWPAEPSVRAVLSTIGPVLSLPDERRFATGCAVACMQAWAHALAGWTVAWADAQGLDPDMAQRIAGWALQVAGTRLQGDAPPAAQQLFAELATPGGLSQSGLAVLERAGIGAAWPSALHAAAARAGDEQA